MIGSLVLVSQFLYITRRLRRQKICAETSDLTVQVAAKVSEVMSAPMFTYSRNTFFRIRVMYVLLAQLRVNAVVRLVAFHFTMAYHELTVAMAEKALQNWPIANTEYVPKVRANSVDILLAVLADQTGS